MEDFYENLKKHFESTSVEELKKQWKEVKDKESIGILIDDLYKQIKTMKNIYLMPTDKPSRLYKFANKLHLDDTPKEYYKKFNIHIVSDEQINEAWGINLAHEQVVKPTDAEWANSNNDNLKKIILTTDPKLIVEGVQKIDDDFLNWFVKNPTCEYVEVEDVYFHGSGYYKANELSEIEKNRHRFMKEYQIIIPQEEPKQENNKFLEKDTIIAWNESVNFLKNYKTDEIVCVVDSNGKIDLEACKILKRISELNREKELLFHKLLEICKEEK